MIKNKKVIACYIRLSVEDDEAGKGLKDESNSVSAQRSLILNYISQVPEFLDYGIQEYVDDGYSGTDFRRPSYERLMEDAKHGEVGIIIVKDFSRLGRDYLVTGNLIERILPMLQIRLISINDGYDSNDYIGKTSGLKVALKNIMNAMYSRDLSNKVTSAMSTRAKNGEYMAAKVPFGYVKDPENKHRLIIDDEAAAVVRMIFEFAADGKKRSWIIGYLNANGYPTPSEYFMSKGRKAQAHRNTEHPLWTVTTISDILRNQAYIGNTLWNKTASNISTGKKTVKKRKEDWTVVEGTHEAIVSRELFVKANERTFTEKKRKNHSKSCPLIYCANCGRTLAVPTDKYHVMYRCMKGYGEFGDPECRKSTMKGKDLETAVMENVKLMIKVYTERKKAPSRKSEEDDIQVTVDALKKEFFRLQDMKMTIYVEYRSGGSKEMYLKKKQHLYDRLDEITKEIDDLEQKRNQKLKDTYKAAETEGIFSEISRLDKFDKQMLSKVIDKVIVHGADQLEIIWKPMDPIFQSVSEGRSVVGV